MRDRARRRLDPPREDVPAPICRMVLRAIATVDVVALTFPRLQHTLVADLRPSEDVRPVVFVAPQLFTAAQVPGVLAAHRPELAAGERCARATWGGSTLAFVEQGILTALLNRLRTDAGPEALAVFGALRATERAPAAR